MIFAQKDYVKKSRLKRLFFQIDKVFKLNEYWEKITSTRRMFESVYIKQESQFF